MPEHLLTVIVSKKSQCDFFVVARICSVSFDIQEEKTFHLRRNPDYCFFNETWDINYHVLQSGGDEGSTKLANFSSLSILLIFKSV